MSKVLGDDRPEMTPLESAIAIRLRKSISADFDVIEFDPLVELAQTSVVSAVLLGEASNRVWFDPDSQARAREVLDLWVHETGSAPTSWAWAAVRTRRAELDDFSWYDAESGSAAQSREMLVGVHASRPDWARPLFLLTEVAGARGNWSEAVEWCQSLLRLDPGDPTTVPADIEALEAFSSGTYFWDREIARGTLQAAQARVDSGG